MKYIYKPKNNLEKFGIKVYNILVENFSQTFFVGGMVRDLLLKKKITDIDIVTEATPDKIVAILKHNKISFNDSNIRYGVVIAKTKLHQIEITTLRKEMPSKSRYPHVKFIKSIKQDSRRRDFTINSLYLSVKDHKIIDFYKGLSDLKRYKIKFIGNAQKKMKEDPLRIIRALRFALILNFQIEKNSYFSIKKYFHLIKKLTHNKINNEIKKINKIRDKRILSSVINAPKLLDKYFKINYNRNISAEWNRN